MTAASAMLQVVKEGEVEQRLTREWGIVCSGQEAHSEVCAQQTYGGRDSTRIGVNKYQSTY